MNKLVLDATPLSLLCHPRSNVEVTRWVRERLQEQFEIYVPEVADYEVRRELLRLNKSTAIRELDEWGSILTYLPVTTPVMRRAAELWAEARRKGQPTADPKALDADVIIAAQAQEIGAAVVTQNSRHLGRFVETVAWQADSKP